MNIKDFFNSKSIQINDNDNNIKNKSLKGLSIGGIIAASVLIMTPNNASDIFVDINTFTDQPMKLFENVEDKKTIKDEINIALKKMQYNLDREINEEKVNSILSRVNINDFNGKNNLNAIELTPENIDVLSLQLLSNNQRFKLKEVDNNLDGIYKKVDGKEIIILELKENFEINNKLRNQLSNRGLSNDATNFLDAILSNTPEGNSHMPMKVILNNVKNVFEKQRLSPELEILKKGKLTKFKDKTESEMKDLFSEISNLDLNILRLSTNNNDIIEQGNNLDKMSFIINHEIGHSMDKYDFDSVLEPFLDIKLMIGQSKLEEETIADVYSLIQSAKNFKLKYGEDAKLKFEEFAKDMSQVRVNSSKKVVKGMQDNNFINEIEGHSTSMGFESARMFILKNFDNIDKIDDKSSLSISSFFGNKLVDDINPITLIQSNVKEGDSDFNSFHYQIEKISFNSKSANLALMYLSEISKMYAEGIHMDEISKIIREKELNPIYQFVAKDNNELNSNVILDDKNMSYMKNNIAFIDYSNVTNLLDETSKEAEKFIPKKSTYKIKPKNN